jgi:hypothetical protein
MDYISIKGVGSKREREKKKGLKSLFFLKTKVYKRLPRMEVRDSLTTTWY